MKDDLVGAESVVEIREDELDQEWIKQPRIFLRYAKLLAEAKQDHSEQKANLDTVYAELTLSVRNAPERFDLPAGKLTEKMIDATIQIQPEYKAAMKSLIRSKYRLDMLQAVVDALDHRKKALENMVQLFAMSYFSEPRAKGEKQVLEGKQKDRVRSKVNRSINK